MGRKLQIINSIEHLGLGLALSGLFVCCKKYGKAGGSFINHSEHGFVSVPCTLSTHMRIAYAL